MGDDHPFALCLTHDVDRPYKGLGGLYYALSGDPWYHLRTSLPGRNPYWRFDDVAAIESDLGVRSAFYVLGEPPIWRKPPGAWTDPTSWVEHLGRYDPRSPAIASVLRELDGDGWEVGLHGSLGSARDPARLAAEKAVLEDVLGHDVVGVRQHHLKLDVPETWRHHRRVGLRYDASLGSSRTWGFQHGYRPRRPFDDDFVVFPLTVMETALPDPGTSFDRAWSACQSVLTEAEAHGAVATVLWHPRYFSEDDFPGYRRLYRRLVGRALEMGAWVGPPGDLYDGMVETGRDPDQRPVTE